MLTEPEGPVNVAEECSDLLTGFMELLRTPELSPPLCLCSRCTLMEQQLEFMPTFHARKLSDSRQPHDNSRRGNFKDVQESGHGHR